MRTPCGARIPSFPYARAVPRSILLFAFVFLFPLACHDAGKSLRDYTYPPSFEYIDDSRLESTMWVLARETESLDEMLRHPVDDPAAQQRAVAASLARVEEAVARLDTPGRVTQHPLLNRNLPRFRDRVRRARADVSATPPYYGTAVGVAESCSLCHPGGSG